MPARVKFVVCSHLAQRVFFLRVFPLKKDNTVLLRGHAVCFFVTWNFYLPQVNSSDPSVVNCSIIENYVCGDARERAESNPSYTVNSCSSACCTQNSCNVHPTTTPTDASTAASTTVDGNGGTEVQPPCLGLLLVMLVISVAMKKVDIYF